MEENFYLKLKIFDLQNERKFHEEIPVQSTVNNNQELGNSEKIASQLKSVLLEKHREYMILRSNDYPGNQNSNNRENTNKVGTSKNEPRNNVKSARSNNIMSKKKRNKERKTKVQHQEQINNPALSATAPCKLQQQQQLQDNAMEQQRLVP